MLTQYLKETIVDSLDIQLKNDTVIQQPPPRQLRHQQRNFIDELKQKLISRIVQEWTTPRKLKNTIAVTDIIQCPKQTWYRYKGRIKPEWLDYNKIFYLLDIYSQIGNTVHEYIYKTLTFDYTELTIIDSENHIEGRIDIIDGSILLDIKSSRSEYDVRPQLSLYYYLATQVKQLCIDKVGVWWVLLDKITYIDVSELKRMYPKYVERANKLWEALQLNTYPVDLGVDTSSCQYCLIESFCKSQEKVTQTKTEELGRTKQHDDIITLV